jgi:hypothetical protein
MGIQDLATALRPINPTGRNPGGACVAIARKVAQVLTLDDPPSDVSSDNNGKTTGLTVFKRFPPDGKGVVPGPQVWKVGIEKIHLNTVYVLEDEGHCWNMVRDAQGRRYLIDVSSGTFKLVRSVEDYTVVFVGEEEVEGGGEGGSVTRNLLDQYEDYLALYECGPLHTRYKTLLAQ